MQNLRREATSARHFPLSRWPALLLICALGAATVNMLLQYSVSNLLLGATCSVAATTNGSDVDFDSSESMNSSSDGHPWQWGGRNQDAGYWFDEFQDTLATMQSTYWNGTYWPTTIQWIGAFFDTLLAASDRSFTDALEEYRGNVPGAQTSASSIQSEVEEYFSEIEDYYGNEDVVQIFGAAYDDA